MPIIEESIEEKLRKEAYGHKAPCNCAGCFHIWLSHDEKAEWSRKNILFLCEVGQAMKEIKKLRDEGKLPPDDRVYGNAA